MKLTNNDKRAIYEYVMETLSNILYQKMENILYEDGLHPTLTQVKLKNGMVTMPYNPAVKYFFEVYDEYKETYHIFYIKKFSNSSDNYFYLLALMDVLKYLLTYRTTFQETPTNYTIDGIDYTNLYKLYLNNHKEINLETYIKGLVYPGGFARNRRDNFVKYTNKHNIFDSAENLNNFITKFNLTKYFSCDIEFGMITKDNSFSNDITITITDNNTQNTVSYNTDLDFECVVDGMRDYLRHLKSSYKESNTNISSNPQKRIY